MGKREFFPIEIEKEFKGIFFYKFSLVSIQRFIRRILTLLSELIHLYSLRSKILSAQSETVLVLVFDNLHFPVMYKEQTFILSVEQNTKYYS